jgi:hypothetical protein
VTLRKCELYGAQHCRSLCNFAWAITHLNVLDYTTLQAIKRRLCSLSGLLSCCCTICILSCSTQQIFLTFTLLSIPHFSLKLKFVAH